MRTFIIFSILLLISWYSEALGQTDTVANAKLKVSYLNEEFNRELIFRNKFTYGQLLPLKFQIELRDSSTWQSGDYLIIQNVVVYFVQNYTVVLNSQSTEGDFVVMMGLYWPDEFSLASGSRIVIKVNFSYYRENRKLYTKDLAHEIWIAPTNNQQAALDSALSTSNNVRSHYDHRTDITKLSGAVFSAADNETWEILFDGKRISRFTSEGWIVEFFGVKRLDHWKYTGKITEFVFHKIKRRRSEKIHFSIPYDPTKKYLLFKRNDKGKGINSFDFEWTDENPESIHIKRIFPYLDRE